jgi:hypothetical protein
MRARETTTLDTLLATDKTLPRLRALSIDPLGDPALVYEILAGPLGERLTRLEVIASSYTVGIRGFADSFDRCPRLRTLALRFKPTQDILDPILALDRSDGGTRMIVELYNPLDDTALLVQTIGLASRGIVRVEVRDLGAPAQIADRQRALLGRLRAMFQEITLVQTTLPSLAL